MRKKARARYELLIIPIILTILILSGGWASMSKAKDTAAPDIQEKLLTMEDGTALRYTLSLPSSISTKKAVPLVLALHYGGTVTPYFGKDILVYLVEPALRGLDAVMASPDCPARGWNNPTSERAVLSLLDYLLKNYPIDKNKIVVTGYSLGAFGTWYLVSRHPHVFSAAIPISGVPREEISLEKNETPVYIIHSQDDELIPLVGVKQFIQEWKSRGLNVRLEVISGIGHYDYSGYVQALRKTVPWLKKVWQARKQD
ncbi:MAG: prolyl oligopeptidase family serine peptidase [Clostridiales bacterium]|nr:prolyl oligopeptidase family serine peptidase [Clostridiales bacterium]